MKINDLIDRLFYNSTGQLIISAIFGLSIALLFKRVCKENCVLYFAPKKEEIENKSFKIEETCYKYKIKTAKCNNEAIPFYEGYDKPDNQLQEPTFISKRFA